jgi:uncharacterized repeat protein (TIGR01451 family)
MPVTRRHLAHLSTAVLLCASAAAVGTGTPAVAAPGVDLAITASSTQIAAGSTVKGLSMEVTNTGTATAHGFTVWLDFGCTRQGCFEPTLDLDRVGLRFRRIDNDPLCGIVQVGGNAEIKCPRALLPGQRVNLNQFGLAPLTQTPGPAGTFKAIVTGHDEGSNGPDNTANVAVEIVAAKPDLVAAARDIAASFAGTGLAQRITPGQTATLDWLVENFSPFVVTGIELTAQLPENISFVTRLPGCTYSADGRQVTCSVAQLPDPLEQGAVLGPDEENPWLVKVASDAPGPAQLAGTFTARATASKAESDTAAVPPADGSSSFHWLTTKPAVGFTAAANSAAGPEAAVTARAIGETATTDGDADPEDNTDGFTVFVGQGQGPSQGGPSGGNLPITGTGTGLIASVGGALLLAGLVLVLMVRRTRRNS